MNNLKITHTLHPHSNSYWYNYNLDKRKVLSNGNIREESEDFCAPDDLAEYIGKWGIVNSAGEVLIQPIYDYIDFFGLTDCYKVMLGALDFCYDHQHHQLLLKGSKSGVIDSEGKMLIPVQYDWIDEIAPNLWAVNKGGDVYYNDDYQENYWTVRGGKWGVVNSNNKEVVPILYDVIMKNWFRVKDLIIVQNGTEQFDGSKAYDVYNFEGGQLDGKKINYKDHIYYKG